MTGASSNTEWKQWGDTDPFWGVASWEGRERNGTNPWTAEEFYALGRRDWADFCDHWKRYGFDAGCCVEIGCGAGRLTKHLVNEFQSAIGVDVSEGMLQAAREHVTVSNVDFRLGDGLRLPVEDASATGVFSTIVFQHFDSLGIALANFSEIHRVLKPEGSIMIQLPVYEFPPGMPGVDYAYRTRQRLSDLRAKAHRRRGQPLMRMMAYSQNWLLKELPNLGFENVELSLFRLRSSPVPQTCVFARAGSKSEDVPNQTEHEKQ